jgi:hypothetical protein
MPFDVIVSTRIVSAVIPAIHLADGAWQSFEVFEVHRKARHKLILFLSGQMRAERMAFPFEWYRLECRPAFVTT